MQRAWPRFHERLDGINTFLQNGFLPPKQPFLTAWGSSLCSTWAEMDELM